MDAGELNAVLSDRRRFISRLRFEDATANVASFRSPYSEQRALIEALMDSTTRSVVVLKPRQIGITTANCADTFWETFAATKPLRTIVAADHNKTTKSIFKKFCTYYNFLPASLKAANPFKINQNDKTLISQRSGALIDHMTARGNAHGRGWTYQRMIAEELAFWTHPEDVWAGLRSTLHEGPDTKIIIVSTPNGPGNFYHERVLNAMEAERNGDTSTKFIFSKWSDHKTYRLNPPSGWEPSEEEWQLKQLYELDMAQLYWRHEMIHGVEGMGERRFRREFPLTVEDGFIVLEGCWFDSDYLNDRLHLLPSEQRSELRMYIAPEMGVNYVIGCDPSWCTGGDFAVACVMDEFGNQCAVLSIQNGGEDRFAEELTNLSRHYNQARVLCEANTGGAGRIVIKALLREGTPIWRDPKGNDWTTSRGNKEIAYGNARQLLNGDAFLLNDHATISELMHVREVKGRIEGQDGYHDDHADAFVLAVWALRTCPGWQGKPKYSRREYQYKRNPADRIRRAIG
jgi:hypothetical protein|tara:strand:+ start:2113 stop:3657 length:1545 start_codon:yes stop_codon:yes gene_type:complete